MIRVTWRAGQIIIAQRVHILCARFFGELFEHFTGEHFGTKNGGHTFLPDLRDQCRDFLRGGFAEIARLDRADNFQTITRTKEWK